MAKGKREIRIPRNKPRPVPKDFASVAPLHNLHDLREIYHCGAETVKRWCAESGVDFKRGPAKRNAFFQAKSEILLRAECEACLNCPLTKCVNPSKCPIPAQARRAAKSGLTLANGQDKIITG